MRTVLAHCDATGVAMQSSSGTATRLQRCNDEAPAARRPSRRSMPLAANDSTATSTGRRRPTRQRSVAARARRVDATRGCGETASGEKTV